MLVLNEHFSGTNGAAWPNGWYTYTGASATYTLQDGAGLVDGGAASWWAWWSGPSDKIMPPDFDITYSQKRLFNGGDYDYSISWGSQTLGNENWGYGLHSQTYGNWMRLYQTDYTTLLGDCAAPNFTYLSTLHMRVRQVGKHISIKRWNDSAAEPQTWDLEVTDTTRNQRSYLSIEGYDNNGGTNGQVIRYDKVVVDDLKTTPTVRNTTRYRR